ncbi:site-specific recombinase XerD [Formosa agariphila KMM 3901]|uniref:Site-specific recombinase XerD n=1 Tax=Formosa agariphila (strain DSM 15362 / KCTC 12365 / LMG 23005 / KMM 3901 / M-2Alg 35-1) TaxID=1347342 RepID=T2KQQ1_FORAG|nr:site-specific integrase [Formosa agariphila]CDF80781.1 site-specific recombinase XerD [Formosa agariphila KMM 3901]
MSSSVKVVIRKKPNEHKEYPLAIRITKERKSSYHYIGQYILLEHWDKRNNRVKKSHPYADNLNSLLLTKIAEANKSLLNLQEEDCDISSSQIKEKLYTTQSFNFFDFSNTYLEELKVNNKLTRLSSEKAYLGNLLKFNKSKNLTFKEINVKYLNQYKTFLKSKRSLNERSAINNLIFIRTIFNRAIQFEVTKQEFYPFGKHKIKIKFPETKKIGLNHDEIKKIEDLKNLSDKEIHARNIWLFSFYLAGIRAADVFKLKWNDISDGRLNYEMDKNTKKVTLKMPEQALKICNSYLKLKQTKDDFIFPEMKFADFNNPADVLSKIKAANRKTNKYLKSIAVKAEITKSLTMHISRHSFGNIAGDRISPLMLQKLYRHSHLSTTIGYQGNFIHKDADDALDRVINF